MPSKRKLSLAQVYLLVWMDRRRTQGESHGTEGVGIARTNSVPPCIELPDGRYAYEPLGVSMAAVNGLVKRGLVHASGYGNAFFTITDGGRAVLAACTAELDALVALRPKLTED